MIRHFTATGFIVNNNSQVLLHWHPKVCAWLPPGGHIDDNEDPVQAVIREISEETGVVCKVISTSRNLEFDYPVQLPPPFAIMIENIDDPVDGYHQHIDMIYFCRPTGSCDSPKDGWLWVSRDDLTSLVSLAGPGSKNVPPPDDVRLMALHAIETINLLSQ